MSAIDKLEINPMDWHNTRMLDYIPKHFARVRFNHNDRRLEVLEWLQEHTKGRFAIEVENDPDDIFGGGFAIKEIVRIGFEDPAEATMYTMFFR